MGSFAGLPLAALDHAQPFALVEEFGRLVGGLIHAPILPRRHPVCRSALGRDGVPPESHRAPVRSYGAGNSTPAAVCSRRRVLGAMRIASQRASRGDASDSPRQTGGAAPGSGYYTAMVYRYRTRTA